MHNARITLGYAAFPAVGIFADANGSEAALQDLQTKLQALIDDSDAIYAGAAADNNRDVNDDELALIEANGVKAESLQRQINARTAMINAAKGQGRRTTAEPRAGSGDRPRVETVRLNSGTGGFKNFGDFASCVRAAAGGDQAVQAQTRLNASTSSYANEGTGSDGGFAVPPDFRRDIAEKVMGEGSLMDRTDRLVTSSNSMMLPKDETTPWQTSGGIQAAWEGEGKLLAESKPALEQDQVRLNKLTVLVNVTDELLADAALLDTYLRRKAPVKMVSKINTAIIAGNGAGMPLGILRSPSLVTVAKETSQAADSIYFENIVNMESRLYSQNPDACVWLINQNVLPQLMQMRFVRGATSPVPVWLPANGLAGQRFSTLMGKPVIPVQACSKLGDLGDIILADMSQYMTATKGTDIRTDISIHLHFDQDLTSYRFILRVAGQPWWKAPITPQNATESLGAFVALAERA